MNAQPTRTERRRLHRAYLFQNGFVVLIAFTFLVTAISFWLNPDQIDSALGHVPPYDYYWNAFYVVGGTMAMIGLFTRRIGIEAAGHSLLVPGLVLNIVIATTVLGLTHRSTILTFAFGFAALLRAVGLLMGWRENGHE